ncbi:MAG: molybdenum cofactor guanylyltransferase [Peptostreptococcaceae bacterium]
MDNIKSAIILAGGKSSRMQFDKQFLVIKEKRLIYEIAKNLEKHFNEIIIISNKKEYYTDSKYKVINDEMKDMGPLAGIAVGLKESNSKFVYIVACDMPKIDDNYITYLKEKIQVDIELQNDADVYISNINGQIELFHGFYKKELSDEINIYLLKSSKKSIISFFERTNKNVYYINDYEFMKNRFTNKMFTNLNTKTDLEFYEKEMRL